MKIFNYKELELSEIESVLFAKFNRYRDVKKCWRRENEKCGLKEIAFIEQWGSDDYEYLIK